MKKVTFFANSNSLANVSIVKAQIEFFNLKNCDLTIATEPLTTELATFRKNTYFRNTPCKIVGVNELYSTDFLCFIIAKISDLIFLSNLPKVSRKLILLVPFEIYKDATFKLSLSNLQSLDTSIVVCVRHNHEIYALPYRDDLNRAKIKLLVSKEVNKRDEFFEKNCWLPLFIMDIEKNIRLGELHIEFLNRCLDGEFANDRIYSDNYFQKLRTRLPNTKVFCELDTLISGSLLKRAYLDYILNKGKGDYSGHHKLMGGQAYLADECSFASIHSLLDPVNSLSLSSTGIKFCSNSDFSKAVFSTYETMRTDSISPSRKLVSSERTLKVVFVLGRCFPDSVSDKTNSHYNVVKLFSALIHRFNHIQCNYHYEVKILVTNEKTFHTPFGTKDPLSSELVQSNIENFVRDGVIDDKDDLLVGRGSSKSACIENAIAKLDDINPMVCVFLGGTYDSKISRTKIYSKHPIAFLPTTSTVDNAYGKIDGHLDVIRAVSKHHSHLIESNGIDENKVVHFSKPMFEKLELKLSSWDWSRYVDGDDGFFIATPLVGGRITNWLSSLTDIELDNFISTFISCPSLRWVPIGSKGKGLVNFLLKDKRLASLLEQSRIIPIEFTSDLGSLIEKCDGVFIPTLGGATTVAAATSLGVVSIVDRRSDSNTIIPDIGQFDTFSNAFDLICKIYHNREYSDSVIEEARKSLNKRFDVDNISREFIDFLRSANAISLGKKVKKLLILGAGVYQIPLIKAARKRNFEVHVASSQGKYPGFEICDKAVYIDTTDYKSILEYCLANNISGITTTGTDVAMKSIGYAVEHGGYNGPDFSASIFTTNKVEMKCKLAEHQVKSAKFEIVRSKGELMSVIGSFSLPVMVKAVDTSGSRGIIKVDTLESLESAFEVARSASRDSRIIVEEFLEGTEFGAQVFVLNNKVVDVIIHGDEVTAPPVAVPIGHYLPYNINKELQEKVTTLVEDTVSALGIDSAICNFDLMEVNDEPYIIEVGSRMGATCLPENIGYHHGINYYDLLIDIAVGKQIEYQPISDKLASVSRLLISQDEGYFSSFTYPNFSQEGYVIDIQVDVEKGDYVHSFVNGTHRYGHVVVSGPHLSECNEIVDKIIEGAVLELDD